MEHNRAPSGRSAHPFRKVLHFPVTRMILAVVFVGIGVAVAQVLIALLKQALALSSPLPLPFVLLEIILAVLAASGAYYAYVRLLEHRRLRELSTEGVGDLGIGILSGLGLFALVVGILWLLGAYQVTGTNDWSVLIGALAADVPSAVVQQIVFQAIIFRITEELVGTWWALVMTVLLFVLLHLIAAQITVTGLLSDALGGLLFTSAYLLTRRLWLPIGLHAALDFTKDGIFGAGVAGTSGGALKGVLQAKLTGPVLLTGGAAGAEASLVAILVLLVAGVVLLMRATQAAQLVPPFWQRERPTMAIGQGGGKP
jgi:membrane protease YdiL (CAAX protease family)